MTTHLLNIADSLIELSFSDERNSFALLPSFKAFVTDKQEQEDFLFHIVIDDRLNTVKKSERRRIRTFNNGNGDIVVDQLINGGYQYIIRNKRGNDCALLIVNENFNNCRVALNGNYTMRAFGLNTAIMLSYAFAACARDTLLMHASVVREGEWAYAFIAPSGIGKSTQASLWLKYLPNCDLLNDDNPVLRIINGEAFIYGSPWSGKTPCYRNIRCRLGGMTLIDRSTQNSVERLQPAEAFATLLPSCSVMTWDIPIYHHIQNTISELIARAPIYTLHCRPDKEAAITCHKAISKTNCSYPTKHSFRK